MKPVTLLIILQSFTLEILYFRNPEADISWRDCFDEAIDLPLNKEEVDYRSSKTLNII
jgi:hypothetical protein